MGFADVAKNYKPKENDEFGPKKKLIGEAVCEAELVEITGKKTGAKWVVLKTTVIHPIEDKKGRETTLRPGDEISLFYDPSKDESIQKLMDDLFTAGIEYDKAGSDADVLASMTNNVKGQLVYMKTWCKDKTEEQVEERPDGPKYWQNIKVLSANKITDENRVPVSPF